MLNQTLPHFFFQLNHPPPPSSSPSPLLSSSGAPPSVSPLVTESYSKFKTKKQQEMEFVEEIEALKTSFWTETTTKSNNPQLTCEDFLGINGGNGVVFGDDLFVEGLLDFSNEDVGVGFVEDEEEKESISASSSSSSSSSSQQGEKYDPCGGFSEKEEPLSVPDSELGVPADDLADLEWLSHFVEDSFSEFSFQHVTGTAVPEKTQTPKQSRRYEARPMGFLTSFPAKARSKRSRTGGRVWSVGLLPSSESSSSSSSSYPVSPSSSSSCLINNSTGENLDAFKSIGKPTAPAAKRQKKKAGAELQQRRCSHCGVQKTPQWRTGPRGAKTLCNACGVRYKSGRLLPEYRPACSPTFSSDIHSNNHRKVLEMRRKKEMGPREPGGAGGGGAAGLAVLVQSF